MLWTMDMDTSSHLIWAPNFGALLPTLTQSLKYVFGFWIDGSCPTLLFDFHGLTALMLMTALARFSLCWPEWQQWLAVHGSLSPVSSFPGSHGAEHTADTGAAAWPGLQPALVTGLSRPLAP